MIETIFDPYNYPFWIMIISIIAGLIIFTSRPFSTYIKFAYPNAKLESIGNPYIKEKEINTLIESKTLKNFKESLNKDKEYMIKGETTDEIQKEIDESFFTTLEMMKQDSSKKMKSFYETYQEKIDIYLVKKELKNKILNDKIDDESIDKTLTKKIKKLLLNLQDSKKEDLSKILINYGFSEKIDEILNDKELDFLYLDNLIDRYIIDKLEKTKVPYKCENAKKKYVKLLIDIQNIKNILRCNNLEYDKETYQKIYIGEGEEIAKWKYDELSEIKNIPEVISSLEGTTFYNPLKNAIEEYNKEKTIQIFEKKLDNLFLHQIRDLSTQYYVSIGPTLRFLISKEFEIKNLKIITKGISENINKNMIKKLLILEEAN